MMILKQITDVLWGWLIADILLITGIYYTLRLGIPQIRLFKQGIISMKKNMQSNGGNISGFSTLCAALGGQVGTGSLVGVATALTMGGPGAIFWMWITALLGMAISFGEATLGLLFREKIEDGTYRGGPSYYIDKGLKSRPLAIAISLFYVFGIGICIASIQTNSIASSFSEVAGVNPLIPGIAVVIMTALVIVGGIKRLADFSSFVIPFMALVYLAVTLYIVLSHATMIPGVIALITKSAFTGQAAIGGLIGHTIQESFRYGVARGLFSNDAGDGAAAILHSAANVKHPISQSLLAMIGTFITTIIICSCTAFAILFSDVLGSGKEGINLLQEAFGTAFGMPGKWLVFGAMFLFGFTTLLADVYIAESNLMYAFKKHRKPIIWTYRIIAAILLTVSAVMPLISLWSTVDMVLALVVLVNIFALWKLFKYVRYLLSNYEHQLKQGIEDPEWDCNIDITTVDLTQVDKVVIREQK